MPSAYFVSGQAAPPSYTVTYADVNQSSSISIPTARTASNGNAPIKIVSVRAYLAGRSASRSATISISGNTTGTTSSFSVASGTAAANTGFKALDTRLSTTPTTRTATITTNGSMYFGNDAAGASGNSVAGISGRTLWGEYNYVQVPVTPTNNAPTANQTDQTVTANWSAISDWGGSSTSLGYEVHLATDSSFTSGLQTTSVSSSLTSATFTITGNTGATYYTRVYAYNEIRDFSTNPKSVVSSTQSVYLAPAAAAPTWTDGIPDSGRVGVYYSGSATASSSTTLTNTVVSSDLSTYGLSGSFSGNTFYVSGTPTRSGTASFTIRATDTYSQSKDLSQSITISAPYTPSFGDTTFKDGTASTSYGSDSISASYATSVTASWSGVSPGLSISTSGSTVTLSGTPSSTSSGTYSISLSATGYYDGATGSSPTASATATVYINALPVPAWTDTTISNTAYVNGAYSSNVSATNATSYTLISAPSWLQISSSGALSGTPASTDVTYGLTQAQKTFTIRANGVNESIEQTFYIDVVHPVSIYKNSSFGYPTQNVKRYDQSTGQFISVANIRRRNASNTGWDEITPKA